MTTNRGCLPDRTRPSPDIPRESNCSDVYRSSWPQIPDSSQPRTNPKIWEFARSRFPATTPKAPHANSGRSSVGSKSFRNGAPAVKVVSAFSNAATGCADRSTKDRTASGAGSDSASSPIPSFISVPTWPGKHPHADPPLRSIHQIALPPAPKPFPLDIREAPALS